MGEQGNYWGVSAATVGLARAGPGIHLSMRSLSAKEHLIMNKRLILSAWICAAIGTVGLMGFLSATISEILFLSHAAESEGWVVGLPDRATDQPLYLYEFPPGTVRRGRSLGGSSSDRYLTGDRLPLYVDARHPESTQIRRASLSASRRVSSSLFRLSRNELRMTRYPKMPATAITTAVPSRIAQYSRGGRR